MSKEQTNGIAQFDLEVPYKLIEKGVKGKKQLIIYLHGYKQNIQYFEKKCSDLLALDGYHLFIQGPYPIYDERRRRKVEQWGRAWYLYDGEQDQFKKSLEKTSIFIECVVKSLTKKIEISRTTIFGYSMGGYLAGYFALSRPGMIDNLIVAGGRIKTELFNQNSYKNINALHIHGKNDSSVSATAARKSCKELENLGFKVTFKQIDAEHKLSRSYIKIIKAWLTGIS